MNRFSLISRLLHFGMATGVTLQLLLSIFMERPRPGEAIGPLEALGFSLHEWVGALLLPLLSAWFIRVALRRDEPGLRQLFPWFRSADRREVLTALRLALRQGAARRLAPEAQVQPLIKAVHGLGALCALFMGVSGGLVWLSMGPSGALPAWGALVLDLHQAAANLMWTYLAGHAGMALLHQWRGEKVLGRMF